LCSEKMAKFATAAKWKIFKFGRAHYGRDIIVRLLWKVSPSFLGVFARKFDRNEGFDILSKSLSYCARKMSQNSALQQKMTLFGSSWQLLWKIFPNF
jgi:hypothetical protein